VIDQVDLGPGVRAGFTDRHGGVSPAPYDGLNLGDHVGDDPDAVAENRRRVAEWLGAPLVLARQVHGSRVVVLASPADAGEADGLVSVDPGVAVGVMVADCVPVLLADHAAGVVGAAHAGRPGLVDGVLQATVAAMVEAGARVERIVAALGPSIQGVSYEVPAGMRDDVEARVPGTAATTSWGTPALDLPSGVAAVLADQGVTTVVRSDVDTYRDPRVYSFRRDGRTGRFAGVIRPLTKHGIT